MKKNLTIINQTLTVLTVAVALLGGMNCGATAISFNVASGDWNTPGNWTPAQKPVAGDAVTIPTGKSVTGLGGANQACASIVIQGTGSLTVDANTLTLTTTVTVGNSGGPATLTIASGATMTGITTLSFAGTTPTVANNGTLSLSTFGSGGTVTQGANANLTLTQANGVAPAGTLVATASGNTVTYSGSGPAVKVTTYQNLTFSSGGGSYSWSSSIVVGGTLTSGGTTVINNLQGTFGAITQNGGNVTCNAAITVSGNLLVSSGTFYAQSGLLTVTGTTTVNGGTLQLGNSAAFTGDYTLSSGAHNNSGNGTVSVAGNFTASGGTFTSGTGVHTFSGTSKTITGPVTIQKATVTGTYAVSGTLTASTALGLTSGGLTSANNITLGNAATITRDTGTLDAAPTFGTTVNVTYTGSTAANTGPEVPTSTTVLSALAINNTSAGGITLNANITANGACTVATGCKLNVPTTMEIKSTLVMTGTGLLAVSNGGILKNSGSSAITSSATTLTFASGAKFQHAVTTSTGTVPTAGWNANSTLEILNAVGGTPPSGLAQSFGNVTWDSTQSSGCNLVGVNLNSIAGTFTVKNTSTFDLRLGSTQSPTESWGNLVLQGGTLTTSSSSGLPTLNVAGNVTFSGGTLTIVNTAALNVAGNWAKNSGVFTSGAGTVTLNGSSAQTIGGSATTAFNSLILNNAAGASLSQSETVGGTLTLTSGSFAVGANTLTLNGPTIAGTAANLTTISGSSLVFGGSSSGVNIPSSVTALIGLTINNASGVTLNSSPTIGSTLTLTSGKLTTGANTVVVPATASISGGSSSSYVNGKLDIGLTTSSTGATFPVGDATAYAPVSLASVTCTQNGDLVVSTVADKNSQGAFSSSGLSQTKYVNRDWTINAANGYAQSAGDVTFNFAAGDIQGGMSTTADIVKKYASSTWTEPTVASRSSTSITVSGISSFSDWVIGLPTPSFSGLSSQTITYGATSVVLTGTLSASGSYYPVNGSTVTASINGHAVNGTVTDGTGGFSITYNDSSLPTNGVGGSPYTITYSFAGDANLGAAANDTSTTLTINPKAASVTADAKTKSYGATNPSLTATVVGEVVGGATIAYTLATDATQFSVLGVSNITVTLGSNPNYTVLTTNSTLTINPAGTSVAVASSENPSGLGVGVVFTATLPAAATGSVNFLTNGILFSTELLNGGLAMTTNSTLPQGTNLITAQYAGDGNYLGSTNDLAGGQIVTNAAQASTSVAVSSSANPSGYKDSVFFTATLPTNATVTVIFLTNGVLFDTQALSGGIANSLSITNLPRGTNIITVEYAGDGNFFGSTNTLDQVVTNHPPVANNASYTRNTALTSYKILVSDLLTNATDVDSDTLALAFVSATTNSATITVSGGYVMYSNVNAVADEFTYTVSDGFGGTNSATVTINVDSTPLFGQSQLVSTTGGTATLNFAGIPGYSYSVTRSTNLSTWSDIWITNAPPGGVFMFTDTNAPQPTAFYRLQFNP